MEVSTLSAAVTLAGIGVVISKPVMGRVSLCHAGGASSIRVMSGCNLSLRPPITKGSRRSSTSGSANPDRRFYDCLEGACNRSRSTCCFSGLASARPPAFDACSAQSA